LHKYITGIIHNREQKLLAIFAMPDHIHLLVGIKPNICVSDLVRDIKAGSSKFINDSQWIKGKFNWQEGYGAFSYSRSQIDDVINYIAKQEEHHKKKTFKEEYLDFLKNLKLNITRNIYLNGTNSSTDMSLLTELKGMLVSVFHKQFASARQS